MTLTTGRPAAASSSSRTLVTPGRRLANAEPPHTAHTGGRSAPQRGQARVPSSASPTAASQRSHRVSDRQLRQARSRARPGVLCTHTTVVPGRRRWAISGDETNDVRHGSSRERSTSSTIGQLVRSTSTARRTNAPPAPVAAAVPTIVGHGEVSTTGTPARRARSSATSRACHVGLRSSCSASSCSSTTTMAARSGHGAHTAARAPITTSTPLAAADHSVGAKRDRQPGPPQADGVHARRDRSTARPPGWDRRSPPRCSAGITSSLGPSRSRPPRPPSRARASVSSGSTRRPERCDGPRAATIVGGLAATRNGRSRPAAQRRLAQRARSSISGGGPTELTLAIGRSRSALTSSSGSRAMTHPPDAPAVERDPHQRADGDGGRHLGWYGVVEVLVEPGDVGEDPGDHRRWRGVGVRRRRRT